MVLRSTQAKKLPLNQLPPIISADNQPEAGGMLQPSSKSPIQQLPPIVTPSSQNQPFVYRQTTPKRARSVSTPNTKQPIPNSPGFSGQPKLPPIVSGNSRVVRQDAAPAPTTPQAVGSGTRSLPPIVTNNSVKTPPVTSPLPVRSFSNSLAPGDMPALPEIEIEEADSVVEPSPETTTRTPFEASTTNATASGMPGTN